MASSFKLRYRPAWALFAAVSVVLVVMAAYVATGLESAAKKRIAALTRTNEGLRRSNGELADYGDEALRKVCAQADMFRATLLSEARVTSFKQAQQPFWRVVETHSEQTQEYRKVQVELTRLGSPMSDWPKIVEAVQNLQGSPGMTVRQLSISTSGDANQRTFDRVTLGVTLFVRPDEGR